MELPGSGTLSINEIIDSLDRDGLCPEIKASLLDAVVKAKLAYLSVLHKKHLGRTLLEWRRTAQRLAWWSIHKICPEGERQTAKNSLTAAKVKGRIPKIEIKSNRPNTSRDVHDSRLPKPVKSEAKPVRAYAASPEATITSPRTQLRSSTGLRDNISPNRFQVKGRPSAKAQAIVRSSSETSLKAASLRDNKSAPSQPA